MRDLASNPFRDMWDRGFKRLVPVVPPNATIHPKSHIAARLRSHPNQDPRGKVPGFKDGDYWRGLDLTRMEAEESDLDAWNGMGASVGVKLGQGLMALDVDTLHKPTAERVFRIANETLGNPGFVRFGNAPKCLMLYRCPLSTGYKQLRFTTPDEDDARVEILTEGRQFVAIGIHPKTAQPYRWNPDLPTYDALCEVDAEALGAFMAACAKELNAKAHSASDNPNTPEQELLKAPSWEALRSTVDAIPNNDAHFPTRDDYITMAYAIKAAAPEGYEYEARDLYFSWCDRWDRLGGEDAKTDAERDDDLGNWSRAKPPFRVGYAYLQENAALNHFTEHEPYEIDTPSPAEQQAPDLETTKPEDMFAAQTTEATPLFELLNIEGLNALPDPKFIIERHVCETALGFLYGDPGSGKSFIALDWALHIACGMGTWHGDKIEIPPNAHVLYIAREGATGFKSRIAAWMTEHGVTEDHNVRFSLLRETINFMDGADLLKLVRTVINARLGRLVFIVVDTVSRVLPGADENLQKEMTLFIKACDALQDATGATVLGVHHAAKSGAMRGSSVLKGAGDFVFRVEKQAGSQYARLLCEKQKDAPDGWSENYRLSTVEYENAAGAGSSLVPIRVDPNAAADSEQCSPGMKDMIFNAMQAAWDRKEPWSTKHQARERYVLRIVARDFDVRAAVVQQWVRIWLEMGDIIEEECCAKSHIVGLRPAVHDGGIDEDLGVLG